MKTRMRSRRTMIPAAIAALLCMATSAHGAVIFSDNFDTDAASSALNFSAFNNWTVSDGTVDYIRSGGFGITCAGGTGGCVDLDGSTNNAGRLTSITTFSFDAGVTYSLTALVSGNQRGGANDTFTIGLLGGPSFTITVGSIPAGDPFTARGLTFSNAAAFTAQLFVETSGGDNIGPILDDLTLSDDRTTRLPEPGTLGLLALCLASVAAVGRRRG